MKKLALLLMLTLIVSACVPMAMSVAETVKPVEIAVNVGPEPDSIDPAYNEAVDGATMIIHAFEGLMKMDASAQPVLGVAESYEVSDDGLTYTFKLRDTKWSDGKPVVASDFIYAWKRAIDPMNATSYAYMFDVIKGGLVYQADPTQPYDMDAFGVSAPDDKTIVITLISPCPYFLELCAFPTYSPVRADVVEGNEAWATDPATYITNGPFKMESWTHSAEIVFVKNENYYDADSITVDKLTFTLIEDDNARLAAYESGQVLMIDSAPQDAMDSLKLRDDFKVVPQYGTYFVCFNNTRKPFDDVRVRKALSLVIDRNYIVENLSKTMERPADAYVSYGLAGLDPAKQFRDESHGYYSVKPEDYEANVAEAQKLLAEAGYPGGVGFPAFEYLLNVSSRHQLIGEYLQQVWATKLGITCTLASQEWGVFLTTRQNAEYDVCRHGWLPDYNDPVSFLDMWITGGGNNDAKYSNPEYDALIKIVKEGTTREERFTAMHQAEEILMNDMAIAPLYFYTDYFLLSPKLQGMYQIPLGFKFFMYCTLAE